MNKKIKIIDLIDKIYHKSNIPKKIKINENIYSYDYDMGYFRVSDDSYNLRVYLTEDLGLDVYEDLVREVEILEDNTEEIEEIGEYEFPAYVDKGVNVIENKLLELINENRKKINEIIRKLNKLNTNKD